MTSSTKRSDSALNDIHGADMDPDPDSLVGLLRQFVDDFSMLFRKEVALAKSEFRQAADEAKAGVAGLAGGVGLAFCGMLFILLSAVFALAMVIPSWAAALTVGVLCAVIGFAMLKVGQKKIVPQAFVPERTIDSMRKDKETVKRATS